MRQRCHVPGLLVPAAVKSQVGLYSGFCYLHMKYSSFSLKWRSTNVNHQSDSNRRVRLFLRTRPSVTEESSKSSRRLKPSSISSGSSSVCLIYGPQLKLSSFESPVIFFPPPASLCSSQFSSRRNLPDVSRWLWSRPILFPQIWSKRKVQESLQVSLSRSFLVNDGRLNTMLWGTPEC